MATEGQYRAQRIVGWCFALAAIAGIALLMYVAVTLYFSGGGAAITDLEVAALIGGAVAFVVGSIVGMTLLHR